MDTLRRRYQLHTIIKSGKNEFDKMRLLLDWVANRWKHTGDNEAKEPNALAILEAAEKGERFRCVEYAIVLANCLTAVGYPARTVGLSRLGKAYGQGKGHVCAEVWSNQYQKWILLDGQNDAWWESNGMPLSAYECRQLFVNGREDELQFIGQHKEADYPGMKPAWDAYFYHLTYGYHNLFFQPLPQGQEYGLDLVSGNVTPELYFQRSPNNQTITDDYEDIYPQLNQTKITLRHTNLRVPSDTLEVVLTHTMPYFDRFMVRINGSNWKESSDTFIWMLNKGDNTIEAKAVNLAGIEGKPSRIVLRNNIATSGE